jgi:hypothetical protein
MQPLSPTIMPDPTSGENPVVVMPPVNHRDAAPEHGEPAAAVAYSQWSATAMNSSAVLTAIRDRG